MGQGPRIKHFVRKLAAELVESEVEARRSGVELPFQQEYLAMRLKCLITQRGGRENNIDFHLIDAKESGNVDHEVVHEIEMKLNLKEEAFEHLVEERMAHLDGLDEKSKARKEKSERPEFGGLFSEEEELDQPAFLRGKSQEEKP